MPLPKRIVLTGATGFVGRALGRALSARGDFVIAVTRDADKVRASLPFAKGVVTLEQLKLVRDVDAVVHLAGENVAQRWTEKAKKQILSSRVDGARMLREALVQIQGRKPQVLVSASAIGFYGDRGDEALDERSVAGIDFLSGVCRAWEAAALEFSPEVPRVVIFRFGMVLGKGGAVAKMAGPFRMGVGGRLGSGKQWVSWIHLDDLVALLIRSIDNESMKGIYNAVTPEPVRNTEFTEALAGALDVKARLPAPEFALRLMLGEMAGMFLGGQRVSCQRLQAENFTFRYPRIIEALRASVDK